MTPESSAPDRLTRRRRHERTHGPSAAEGSARALVLVVVAWAVSAGCATQPKNWIPKIAGDGSTENCPGSRIGSSGSLESTLDDPRCGHEEGVGRQSSLLAGTVYVEDETQLPGRPVEAVEVGVYEARGGAPGDPRGVASTDAQGHFRIGGALEAREHFVVVRNASGEVLAQKSVRVRSGGTRLEGMELVIPRARWSGDVGTSATGEGGLPPAKPLAPSGSEAGGASAPDLRGREGDPRGREGALGLEPRAGDADGGS